MKTIFSVIIPTLNEEKFLPNLLSDLTLQNEQCFEVIVVDANSTDKTKSAALAFKDRLPLTFLTSNKKNVAYQKNLGAKNAQGEFLLFIDADCRISSSFLKSIMRFMEKNPGLVFLPYVDPEDTSGQTKTFYQLLNFLIETSQNFNKPFSSVGGILFDKNLFNQIGGFEEKLFIGEDHNIVQKAHKWGVKARFMPNIKIKFSFRRINREGKLKAMYKLFLGVSHVVVKGDVEKEIFEYEMSGGSHYDVVKKSEVSADVKLKNYLKKIKKQFENLMTE